MTRSFRRVHHLAARSGYDVQSAIGRLSLVGISVSGENDLIPPEGLAAAAQALGLDPATFQRLTPAPTPKRRRERKARKPSAEPKRRRVRLRMVGHRVQEMNHLSADEVERIHWILVKDFARSRDPIDPPGVQSRALLESAVGRALTSLGGELKYPTIPMAAAGYLHALTLNHPFHNGNKRTALVAMICYLDINDYVLEADQDELFVFVVRVAAHELIETDSDRRVETDAEMNEVAEWVNRHSRAVHREEKIIKFRDLRNILMSYGCEINILVGNRVELMRKGQRIVVGYRNEGSDMGRRQIREIRQKLGLMDDQGYDSTIFYKSADRTPTFIMKYRRTLDRLAKA